MSLVGSDGSLQLLEDNVPTRNSHSADAWEEFLGDSIFGAGMQLLSLFHVLRFAP
jgi:hypothetical protein